MPLPHCIYQHDRLWAPLGMNGLCSRFHDLVLSWSIDLFCFFYNVPHKERLPRIARSVEVISGHLSTWRITLLLLFGKTCKSLPRVPQIVWDDRRAKLVCTSMPLHTTKPMLDHVGDSAGCLVSSLVHLESFASHPCYQDKVK